MDDGYTNDSARFAAAVAWREAAIADGWDAKPGYPNHEAMERVCHLSKDGYIVHVLTREKVGKWAYQASVNVWGPDGLAIKPPFVYDMAAITAGTRHCNYCNADDVDTERVGFAGRCCAACLPRQREIAERPGWCD